MSKTRHFPANTLGRDFVVGDIHGCTTEFRALLDSAEFDAAKDRVFSVGDLVDRGPDSMGALRLISEPWFFPVMGNHELMMLDAMLSGDESAMAQWLINGGAWHMDHTSDELNGLMADVQRLPLAIVVGEGASRFNVVHAEFFGSDADLFSGAFDDRTTNQMLWGRALVSGRAPDDISQPESPTYVGHTILPEIGRIGSHHYIDTGAFVPHWNGEHGALTMICVSNGNIYQTAGSKA